MEKCVNNYIIGDIVTATAGRGRGRHFLVIGTDGGYVTVSDGETRKLNHLKKKKWKHLQPTGQRSGRATELLQSGQLKDADIRTILKEVK